MKNSTTKFEDIKKINSFDEKNFFIDDKSRVELNFHGYVFTLELDSESKYPYFVNVKKHGARKKRVEGYVCDTWEKSVAYFKRESLRIINLVEEKENQKMMKDAARAAFVHPYPVGTMLVSSWGYEQTNVDFYQVIKTTRYGVQMRAIAGDFNETGFMSGQTKAIKNHFISDEIIKKNFTFSNYDGQATIRRISETKEGETHYESHYA